VANTLKFSRNGAVGFIDWLDVILIQPRLGSFDVVVNQRAQLIRIPVLSRWPPFLEAWISCNITYSAVEPAPKTRIESSIKKMQIEAIGYPDLPS
jgi:hypothetical protein